MMSFKRLTQAQKNKLRRKAVEALQDENYGDDGDGFHEHATAQAVLALLDEIAGQKELIAELKSAPAATNAKSENCGDVPQPPADLDGVAKVLIAAIEKEQERLHDEDYLMDSKDCIDVIREVVQQQELK